MATKIIKLHNGSTTYVPVGITNAIQHSYGTSNVALNSYLDTLQANISTNATNISTLAGAALQAKANLDDLNSYWEKYNASYIKAAVNGNNVEISYNLPNGTYGMISAAAADHVHTSELSIDTANATITYNTGGAGAKTTGTYKASISAYGFVKLDSTPTADSTNAITSSAVQSGLAGKADATHSHKITWSTNAKTDNAGNAVTALIAVPSSQTNLNNDGTATFTTYSVPTKEYVDAQIADMSKALKYQGTIASTDHNMPANPNKGDVYVFSGNNSYIDGGIYEDGDMAIYNGEDWDVVNANWTVDNKNATVIVGGVQTTIATVGGKDIKISVAHGEGTITNISYNIDADKSGVITNVVHNPAEHALVFTYTDISSSHSASSETVLSTSVSTVAPGIVQNSNGEITSVTGISIKQDHEGKINAAAGRLTVWENTYSHVGLTTSYGNGTTKYAYIQEGVLKEGNLPVAPDAFTSIVAADDSSNVVTAGTVNGNGADASSSSEIWFHGGNKWITTGADDQDGVHMYINHALKGSAGTPSLIKIAYDEAGHIGATAAVTIENINYDVYDSSVDFVLDLGTAESSNNKIITGIE